MRRFNCCIFNHPCPIFCPFLSCVCENEIVNPIIGSTFGYFSNTALGAIVSNAIIPLNFVQGDGDNITASTTLPGAINLLAGTYQITYLASGTVPASGTMSIKLRLNGVDVAGSVLTATQPAGQVTNLTQTIVLTVPQTSTLELVSNSSDATTYSYANMFVNVL